MLDHPKTAITWEMKATDINAEYCRHSNSLYIPAGILQMPFYDVNVPDAVNMGGIGTILTHEISHAFDVNGKLCDYPHIN
ncbi:uncharacterized protein LOC111674283 [Orussus abietinus]|uniref:uncharacterized protein LOC111674283 n=1 Tax=Orussus abietinus TaxID=222816 RepID=UPI000C716283|nr:uncharacterized protein LOC111674283 [Orussus abietinus]